MEIIILLIILAGIYLYFKNKSNSDHSARHDPSDSKQSGDIEGDDNLFNFQITETKTPSSASLISANTDAAKIDLKKESLIEFRISTQIAATNQTVKGQSFRSNHIPKESLITPNSKIVNQLAKWIEPGTPVQIATHTITGGLFYFGTKFNADHYTFEASMIDPHLPVSTSIINHIQHPLGYWPSYSQMSPLQRGAYLNWIAGQRNDPTIPIGYVFVYFYGIERRILIDYEKGSVSENEYKQLISEIIRLQHIYTDSRSFQSYSTQLLEYISILTPQFIASDSLNQTSSWGFKYRLASLVHSEKPIPADLALTWLKHHSEYKLRTPARRCPAEFELLFFKKYTLKFGEGIKVKANKTRLKINFRPASPSLQSFQIKSPDLPDPSLLTAPLKPLLLIADSCIDELEAFSRYLGKKGNKKEDIAAILLLPDVLLEELNLPILKHFKTWIERKIHSHQGLATVKSCWEQLNLPLPASLSKKDIDLLLAITQKCGFGLAPDPGYHHAKPLLEGHVVFFDNPYGIRFEPSNAFNQVGMALRLGAMVATINKESHDAEINLLNNLIVSNDQLSADEKVSLQAYLLWRLNTPANMTGLKDRLEKLNKHDKSVISHILISVALADGQIDPLEIKQLEKLYTALGLDKTMVSADIHNLSTTHASKANTVSATVKDVPPSNNAQGSFALNTELLKLHESETQDIQNLLGAIFTEDEPDTEQKNTEIEPVDTKISEVSLDSSHRELYVQLLTHEEWQKADFQELCNKHGLMMEAAIDTLNDWAYELVNAPVIEYGETIWLDSEISEEIHALKVLI